MLRTADVLHFNLLTWVVGMSRDAAWRSHAGPSSDFNRFSTVRMADRILVLKDGELVEQGTNEALVTQGGLYSELFQLQAAGYR